jgi:GntR family transcriptional regulator/MocR family aminotransferase
MLFIRAVLPRATQPARKGRALSERGAALAHTLLTASHNVSLIRPFRPGTPALDAFPADLWSKLLARRWRNPPRELLGYGDAAGYRPLREAIAAYLGAARAVRCEAEQVIIVAGAQQALDLTARLLLNAGDAAWIEDPGYLGTRAALMAAGARVIPVPVDDEGLDVQAGARTAPDARLVYVSPSHQYPLGVTMSLGRRLALLEWARAAGAWIIEDDYDSEYRYARRPLAAMQGLDHDGRVIYLGTFSKVMFPSLRIGYVVAPTDLVDAFVAARGVLSRFTPSIDQAALADFIDEGHFTRHIRRMRTLYAERQSMMVETARRELGGLLEVKPHDAGIHLVGWLREGMDDRRAQEAAARENVEAQALSAFSIKHHHRAGLMLGYAGYNEREIRVGMRRLATALHNVTPGKRRRTSLSL